MVNIMNSGSIDSVLIDELSNEKCTATSLLHRLVEKLYEAAKCEIDTLNAFEDYVLATTPLFEKKNVGFRKLLEEGSILIYDKVETEYITCVPAISFLKKLQSKFFTKNEDPIFKNCNAADNLLKDLMKTKKPLKAATWWEMIVCFTIASRYYDGKPETYVLLGLEDSDVIRDDTRDLKITKSKNLSNIIDNTENDQLLIQINSTAGYDALLVLHTEETETKAFFYLQMKLAPPNSSLIDVVSKMIQNNLNHYLSDSNQVLSIERKAENNVVDDLHMVLYIWGLSDDELRNQVSQDMVLEKLKNEQARKYAQDHWGKIHLVGINSLKSWINPTMIPLAKLFNDLENG